MGWDLSPIGHAFLFALGTGLLGASWLLRRLTPEAVRLGTLLLLVSWVTLVGTILVGSTGPLRFTPEGVGIVVGPIVLAAPLLVRSPTWQAFWPSVLALVGVVCVGVAVVEHAAWQIEDEARYQRSLAW